MFKLASLIKLKGASNLKNDGSLLAKSWLLDKQSLQVLQHYDSINNEKNNRSTSRQFCYLLGVGLILAQEHYFSGTKRCKETEQYYNVGLSELSISQSKVTNMMIEITAGTNVFCHLS